MSSANFQAWIPAEFGQTRQARQAMPVVDMDELEAIFKPASDQTSPALPSLNGQAAFSTTPRAWVPGEFNQARSAFVSGQPWKSLFTSPAVQAEMDRVELAEFQAEKILAEAQAKADDMIRTAHDEADEIALVAHQEGWKAAEAETATVLSTAKGILEQVINWREEMLEQSEPAVLGLIKDMAVKMFGDGIVLENETLQQTFNRVLVEARALGDLRIYVHPEDATNLGPYWREFQVSISGHQVHIVPSEAIRRGGCFVDGQFGAVDARIETQLKSLVETLETGHSQAEEETEVID